MSLTRLDVINRNGGYQYGLLCPVQLVSVFDNIVVTGALKEASPTLDVPPDAAPVVYNFTVTKVVELDGVGKPGWVLSLAAAQTAALKQDAHYVVDEHIVIPGYAEPLQTAPQLLSTRGYVTP